MKIKKKELFKKDKTVKIHYQTKRIKNFKIGKEQLYVEVYPLKDKHDRSDIDIFRLVAWAYDEKTGTKEKKVFDMTPDEAMEIAGMLLNASMFWTINYKPYWDTFMKRKRELNKIIKRQIIKNSKG